MGIFLKNNFSAWEFWLLSGNFGSHLGIFPTKKEFSHSKFYPNHKIRGFGGKKFSKMRSDIKTGFISYSSKNMKITVTGGSGLLGSHVADELSLRGHKVSIFDKKKSKWIKKNQKMYFGDILSFKHLKNSIKGSRCYLHQLKL